MSERDALDNLKRQCDLRKELAEATATVPAKWFLFHRHRAEADRWPPELLLRRQRIPRLVSVHHCGWRDKLALRRPR
jgi:hypothetical protein